MPPITCWSARWCAGGNPPTEREPASVARHAGRRARRGSRSSGSPAVPRPRASAAATTSIEDALVSPIRRSGPRERSADGTRTPVRCRWAFVSFAPGARATAGESAGVGHRLRARARRRAAHRDSGRDPADRGRQPLQARAAPTRRPTGPRRTRWPAPRHSCTCVLCSSTGR